MVDVPFSLRPQHVARYVLIEENLTDTTVEVVWDLNIVTSGNVNTPFGTGTFDNSTTPATDYVSGDDNNLTNFAYDYRSPNQNYTINAGRGRRRMARGSGTRTFSISVNMGNLIGTANASINYTPPPLPGPPPDAFTNTPYSSGTIGVSYSDFVISNGATNITRSGALPANLTGVFSTNAGGTGSPGYVVSGTPTTVGTSNFTLTATNASGSTTYNATIVIGAALPGTPSITSTSSTANSVTFGWNTPANAVSYQVRLGTGSWTSTSLNAHTFSNLQPGTSYTVAVRAVNSTGDVGSSSSTTISTLAPAVWDASIPTINTKIGIPLSGVSVAGFVTGEQSISFSSGTKPDWLTIGSNGAFSGTPIQRASRQSAAELLGLIDQFKFRLSAQGGAGTTAAISPEITINVSFPGRRFGSGGWTPIRIARRFDGTNWVPIQNVTRRTGTSQSNTTPPTTT